MTAPQASVALTSTLAHSRRGATPRDAEAHALREDQYRALLRTTPVNVVINLLTGAGLFAVFIGSAPGPFLHVWLSCVAAIATLRLYLLLRHGETSTQSAHSWPFHALTLSSVVSGLLWGIAGVWLLPGADPTQKVFLAVVSGALVGGSTTTLSPVPLAAIGFAVGVTFPIAGHFFSVGETASAGFGGLAAIFGVAMAFASRSIYRRFRDQMLARLANEALAAQIDAERRQWLELSAKAEAFALFDREDRLVLWNPAFQRALSLPAGSAVRGAQFADLLSSGARPVELLERHHALDNWIAALNPSVSGHQASASYRMSNGRWLHVSSHRTPSGGKVLLMVDVTELKTQEVALQSAQGELSLFAQEKKEAYATLTRKHHELKETMRELARTRDEALHANAAQLEFLAHLSHEFRTPLNAIIGFSELMANELVGPLGSPRYKSYAEDIAESGHQLLGLVNQILDFAKVDSGELRIVREPIDFEAVVSSSCLQLAHAASQAEVSIDVDRKGTRWPKLEADEARLKQILNNLLSNAIKFSPPGGLVRLRIVEAADHAWVIVADRGAGMARGEIDASRALRQRSKSPDRVAPSGLRLGLPLVRSLVELHGGVLRIRSRPGRGTVVAVVLPLDATLSHRRDAAMAAKSSKVVPLR